MQPPVPKKIKKTASQQPSAQTVAPLLSRTGRVIKPKKYDGGAKRKNGEHRNNLSFRLYGYFLSEILSHYNYYLCYNANPAINSNKDSIITSFKDNILLNVKLTDILCANSRITYYYEILAFRILYINYLIKSYITSSSVKLISYISTVNKGLLTKEFIVYKSFENLTVFSANIEYINTIATDISAIINNTDINNMVQSLLNITTSSYPTTPKSHISNSTDNINTINQNNNIYIDIIRNLDFKDVAVKLHNTASTLFNMASSFIKINADINYYYKTIYKTITTKKISNIEKEIAKKVSIINRIKDAISINTNIELIIELLFEFAAYMFLLLYKTEKTFDNILDVSQINDIKKYLFDIIKIKDDFYIYISSIINSIVIPNDANDIIQFAKLIIEYNINANELIIIYIIMFHTFNNINNNNKQLVLLIDDLMGFIKSPSFPAKKENIFLSLYNKQNDIAENIKTIYKNHIEFKADKEAGKIAILIKDDVYPKDITSLFMKKDDKQQTQGTRPGRYNQEIIDGVNIQGTSINTLYSALLTRAKTNKDKPNKIDFSQKELKNIFDIYFKNVNKLGTKIITNFQSQGADTTGIFYNENIIIQNILFITLIANHFNDIIEYKGNKIYDIINTIEKDNTYKIHSFIKEKKSNYYNNDDYKIITLVYACLYNIINIKHTALMNEKQLGRDKYNFIGYYNKKNKYYDIDKLFSMFDLVMEITKSNS